MKGWIYKMTCEGNCFAVGDNKKRNISKGIFWVVYDDSEDINSGHLLSCSTYHNKEGIVKDRDYIGNSKDGTDITHERTWKEVCRSLPRNIRRHK